MVALLRIRPYLFDREFQELLEESAGIGAPPAPHADAEPEIAPPAPPAAPTFSEAELAAAREIAHAEGEHAGRIAAEQSLTAHTTRTLEAITNELQRATAAIARDQSALVRDATAIALTICRKILPHTYRATAVDEIAELVSTVLPRIGDQPLVLVRVAAPLAAAVTEPMAAVAAVAGFTGSVKVVADESLAEGDCRIEWSQGGVIRDAATLLRELEQVIDHTVGHHPTAAAFDRLPLASPAADLATDAARVPESGENESGTPLAAGTVDPADVSINPSRSADTDE